MGIFDALKKRSKRTTVDTGKLVPYRYHDEDNYDVPDEEDYKDYIFFGDLSMSGQKHPDVKSKSKKAFRKNNIDSDDSIVYLSYLQQYPAQSHQKSLLHGPCLEPIKKAP